MKTNFKSLLKVSIIVAATSAMGFSIAAQANANKGGVLSWLTSGSPGHFNSAIRSGTATGQPAAQIFASPLRYDAEWNPQPYLAKSWKLSDDGRSLTLNLVDNATFHDGQPVTSADVAFSLMLVKANHPFKTMFSPVTAVDTPDAHTAIIRMDQSHPAILLAMSPGLLPILPKHIYGDGQDIKTHPANNQPVGSGPFKFVEYKAGEHIILERYEDFFIEGRPYLDKIVMRIIKDGANRTISMERGEGHLLTFEDRARDINRMSKSDSLVITDQGYAAIGPLTWLAFNTTRAPLDNKAVRQAISYAVDKDFIINALMLGKGSHSNGPVAPGSPYTASNVETYDLDLDKANALLDAAGFAKGDDGYRFSLEVDFIPGLPLLKAVAEYLRPQLKKVGIKVTPRPSPDFPTWAKRVGGHDFDMTVDIVFNWGDPVIGVHRTYLSKNIRKGVIWSNTQSYSNAQVDALLEQAGKETDSAKRIALYQEFQKIVVDDAPISFITTMPYHTVYNKDLRNLPTTIWGAMSPLDEVYWDKQ